MAEPIVILHGWSDDSSSFKTLSQFLKDHLIPEPVVINLADWVSMDDDVTYADLGEAMQRAWVAHELPTTPRAANIIVHSTGALVTREWMTRFYKPATAPIKRFLMLAPANFGSPLAHKGHSFIGRAFKGWGNDGFETGKKVLKGLELASPYTWQLAEKDLFASQAWYGSGKILATVLVGNEGYDGLRAIANENGSDGTVRISTANLNCARVQVELDEKQQPVGNFRFEVSKGEIGFGIIAGHNHGNITLDGIKRPNAEQPLENLILKALNVRDTDYQIVGSSFAWQDQIMTITGDTYKTSPQFQNAITRISDNLGNSVDDYFVEFYRTSDKDEAFEREIYETFLESVHTYTENGSYRSLYLNTAALSDLRKRQDMRIRELFVSVTARPMFLPKRQKSQPVGYLPLPEDGSGGLRITANQLGKFFEPHRTCFFDIVLRRSMSDDVFKLKRQS